MTKYPEGGYGGCVNAFVP